MNKSTSERRDMDATLNWRGTMLANVMGILRSLLIIPMVHSPGGEWGVIQAPDNMGN